MTEHQKKLVMDYGPRFVDRSGDIIDQLLYLTSDAVSVLTDEEWKKCAESMTTFMNDLQKVRLIVFERVEELEK